MLGTHATPVQETRSRGQQEGWFDENQHDGVYHQDWQPEGDSAALAAFKAAATAS